MKENRGETLTHSDKGLKVGFEGKGDIDGSLVLSYCSKKRLVQPSLGCAGCTEMCGEISKGEIWSPHWHFSQFLCTVKLGWEYGKVTNFPDLGEYIFKIWN